MTGPLADDTSEKPEVDIVQAGPVKLTVIRRGEKIGQSRARDSRSPVRTEFKGLAYFAIDPRLRIEAVWEASPAP